LIYLVYLFIIAPVSTAAFAGYLVRSQENEMVLRPQNCPQA
jgi:hypothetical protein